MKSSKFDVIAEIVVVITALQMNPISVTAVEESFHEMRDKSCLCSVCGMGMKLAISIEDFP